MEWPAAVLQDALVSTVLETGLERAIREFRQTFAGDVPGEIQRLTNNMILIKSLLPDAEKKQVNKERVHEWLRQLKEELLDAEDLIDEYTTNEALRSTGAGARKKVSIDISSLHTSKIGTMAACPQIHNINQRIDNLTRQKDMLGLQVLSSTGNCHLGLTGRPQAGSTLADHKTYIFGRDSEKDEIINILLSPTNEPESSSSSNNLSFSVLPIVGMGGSGKTTLARLVFNDGNVKKHFPLRMWVCVSADFDPVRLTKEMIDAASASKGKKEQYQITHWGLMQKKLREEVKGRTFLLVLDDVWEDSQSQWEILLEPLNFANKESKILVTSRYMGVATKLKSGMPPVCLWGLSNDDLWELLKRCAFDGYNPEEFNHLEGIGQQIANRLQGLPLCARMIGCLLNAKLDIHHWREIAESELWHRSEYGMVSAALGLCYQYLPGNIRQCFAYCSLFPEDYDFDKIELARLWDAQCFSETGRFMGMEDISARYFDELLHRSFFEESHNIEDRYVMHDLTHELAEYVSKDYCFRLERKWYAEMPDTVRHMSLLATKSDPAELNELCSRHEKLRTLLFLRNCEFDDPAHALDGLFLKLKRLRVIGLRDCGIKELPSSIGDLKHLRYIDLSWNCSLNHLPETLSNLYNLQVLKLEGCKSLRALPTGMSELINLRHLSLTRNIRCDLFSSIDGLGRLTALEEVEVRGRRVRELEGMCMLRELVVRGLEEVRTKEEAIQARLDSKQHLRVLRLEWGCCGRAATSMNPAVEEEVLQALRPVDSIKELEICRYGGAKSPGWMEDPTTWASFCLQRLTLEGCPNWEVLPSLAHLRFLKSLQIRRMPNIRGLDFRFSLSLEHLSIRLA